MTSPADHSGSANLKRKLPSTILALGAVSLCMDTSSELIHSLLPVFMSSVLGASMLTIGVIEGVAEATAAITKIFSGTLSDWLRKRKLLMILGYGLAALTKPIFPLAQSIEWVFGARFVDRIGKGIRGAPRDALVADITPPDLRGAAYGLRQSLDSVGAFLGPALALLFMFWFADHIRAVLWIAVIPAAIAVTVLVLAVREPGEMQARPVVSPISKAAIAQLPFRYWMVVLIGAVFTLARFSEAFLVLRAQNVGLHIGYIPLVLIIMNVVYAGSAYPVGHAADRLGVRGLLMTGMAILIAADLLLALVPVPIAALAGAALWGLHMGFTQGLLSKLVADAAPLDLRGTAFGCFNLVSGLALLAASVVAGELWQVFSPEVTFGVGAVLAVLAAAGLAVYSPASSH